MRSRWLPLACGLIGFAMGVMVCSHVWIQFAPILGDLAAVSYEEEQLALASRAGQGDPLSAAIHIRNAAEMNLGVGFRWLERERARGYWARFTQPWRYRADYRLLRSTWDDPKLRDGQRLVSALYHAQAAAAFEQSVCPALAAQEWDAAASLEPWWTKDSRREFARAGSLRTSWLQRASDDAYLDATTYEELFRALAALRAKLDAAN